MKACRHYELELSAGAVVATPLRRQARVVPRGLRMILVHQPYMSKMLRHQRPRKEEGGEVGEGGPQSSNHHCDNSLFCKVGDLSTPTCIGFSTTLPKAVIAEGEYQRAHM